VIGLWGLLAFIPIAVMQQYAIEADLAIALVIEEQTRRPWFLAAMLGPHGSVVAILADDLNDEKVGRPRVRRAWHDAASLQPRNARRSRRIVVALPPPRTGRRQGPTAGRTAKEH
jgi:hypothetical protein